MAVKKAAKQSPTIFSGTVEPNAGAIEPGKVGDLYVNTDLSTLYFCKNTVGTDKWGTAGTA